MTPNKVTVAQIDSLRKDYAFIKRTLDREYAMRVRVLQGKRKIDGCREIVTALDALRRLGETINAAEIEPLAPPPEQLSLIPEDKPYV